MPSAEDSPARRLAQLEAENAQMRAFIDDLQERLREPEEIIRAIRGGEVDAVVVEEPHGDSIYPLRRADTVYRELVEDVIPFGVWMTGPTGEMSYQSRSFLDFTGLSAEEARGWGWLKAVAPEDTVRIRDRWHHCVSTTEPWENEYSLCGDDGSRRNILCRGVPVWDHQRRLVGWVGLRVDITAHKEVERNLAEEARRKDEFLAILAHELRNPLAPIGMAVDLMGLTNPDPQRLAELRELISVQVRQMARLINDLLDVARVNRGRIELKRSLVELDHIVRLAVDSVRPQIEQHRHDLTVTFPPKTLHVNGDPTRLLQIFENLLTNAAKYTDAGGRIQVVGECLNGEAVVRIRDNGIGIPPDLQPAIFDMFVQVDRTLERSRGGLGIGLSVVKRLVELHGGSITVQSEGRGAGSEFIVRLPLTSVESVETKANPKLEKRAAHGRKIVVIDDSQVVAQLFCQMLTELGHDVAWENDPSLAVAAIRRHRPEVVFSDISMPGLNGYDLARIIRNEFDVQELILVAMTGFGQPEDIRRSREAGFDHHLTKPADLEAIRAILTPRAPTSASVNSASPQ